MKFFERSLMIRLPGHSLEFESSTGVTREDSSFSCSRYILTQLTDHGWTN